MGLSLNELVELAMLDAVMDHAVTLAGLLGAGAPWHELNGRSDMRGMMGSTLTLLLDQKCFTVIEHADGQEGTPLVGAEAAMAVERAASSPEMLDTVGIQVTDAGRTRYKQLAHRYYNG